MSIETIGYGNREIDEFLSLLRASETEFLVDVRSRPYSKFQPAFSKDTLDSILKTNEFKYLFLGDELGGTPDDKDCYFDNGKVNYAKCRLRKVYKMSIDRLVDADSKGYKLMLMCSELRPESCHRCKLIAVDLEEAGIEVLHIDKDGSKIKQSSVLKRLTGGQMDLFGSPDEIGSSRKKYD